MTNFILLKRIKYYALNFDTRPTMSDINVSLFLSALSYLSVYLNISWIIFVFLLFLNFLLFIDAVLFKVYAINIDLTVIKMFLQNYKIFFNSDDELIQYINYRKFYLYPVFTTAIFIPLFFDLGENISFFIYSLYLSYTISLFGKLKFNIPTYLFMMLSVAFFYELFFIYHLLLDIRFGPYDQISLVIITVLGFLTKKILAKKYDTKFLLKANKLYDFIGLSTIDFARPDNYDAMNLDETYALDYVSQHKSENFGVLDRPNIVLITIESLSKEALRKNKLPFFNALKDKGVVSNRHYCINANTYESLFTIYNNAYYDKREMPFIHQLNALGYETSFLTSQYVAFDELSELLSQIGFKNIISAENFSSNESNGWGANDKEFFETSMTDGDRQEPFFLHILNNQSHVPYEVFSSENRQKKYLNKQERYFDAILESDKNIENLLEQILSKHPNTLIIYTADHGQSFGELDYYTHSNAITKEELEVPFLLYHNSLKPQNINTLLTSHFDIFPTIFDLIGAEYENQGMGQSIFALAENRNLFVFTKTRTNNMPTSFGLVNNDHKVLIDLMYERYWIVDLEDEISEVLKNEKKDSYLYFLYELMSQLKINQSDS